MSCKPKKSFFLTRPFVFLPLWGVGGPLDLPLPAPGGYDLRHLDNFSLSSVLLDLLLTHHGPRTGRGEVSGSVASVRWSPHRSLAAPSYRGPLLLQIVSFLDPGPLAAGHTAGAGPGGRSSEFVTLILLKMMSSLDRG